ncbi:MAG: hypothetical protein RIQ81_562 [Pseudomonadota bacterium]
MNFEDKNIPATNSSKQNIVSLDAFKRRKESAEEFVRNDRKPLYVSHLTGKIGDSEKIKTEANDFGDRLQRIRTSLDKINKLISDLKTLS